MKKPWLICLDRGGTFTDGIAFAPDGTYRVVKVLSGPDSPLTAIREALNLPAPLPLPPCEVRLGGTLATNALLERKGARHALITTRGFADALRIGTQQRPELFTLAIQKKAPLHDAVTEAKERLNADGSIAIPLDAGALRASLLHLRAQGYTSLAIVFLHACSNPAHEILAGALAEEIGFEHIALSHLCDPAPGFIARGETTCADAYLTPVVKNHLRDLAEALSGSTLLCMHSGGGLAKPANFRGPQAVLSGPAGGWLACRALAKRLGLKKILGFDMGGTSTDVSQWQSDRPPERDYAGEVAGIHLRKPSVAIHTVAAGGGSLCRLIGGRLTVGPESAGAHPGPLCYGKSGHAEEGAGLTVTDINFFLGRLVASNFPFPLDLQPVLLALRAQVREAREQGLGDITPEELARGYRRVVDFTMAQAIRETVLARGEDLHGHTLIAFGGAGGQHACAVAEALGLNHVVLPPLAGIFSAVGISQARESWEDAVSLPLPRFGQGAMQAAREAWMELRLKAESILGDAAWERGGLDRVHRLDMRYAGSDHSLTVEEEAEAGEGKWLAAFETRHKRHFGYAHEGRPVEAVAARLATERSAVQLWPSGLAAPFRNPPITITDNVISEGPGQVPARRRESLTVGEIIPGPAMVLDGIGTIIVDPLWSGHLDAEGNFHMQPVSEKPPALSRGPEEITLFHAAFMAIAKEMGRVLQRTALSPNIKDRLDFSCAVFDAEGRLVANAPHIPVHLGAMGESVRHILRTLPDLRAGDAVITNHPAHGGSHLPDMTVVSPVFGDGPHPAFFVANRAHHADIGGREPGSMPADSQALSEEGLALSALRLVRDGVFDEEGFRRAFTQGPWPPRNPGDNRADLQAQLAANHAGQIGLLRLCEEQGWERVIRMMSVLRANAATQVRAALRRRGDGTLAFSDRLDDGSLIQVTLRLHQGELEVDFAGTSPKALGNLNAPASVTRSCLLYVVRCLVAEPMPLNEGCLEPVRLILPENSLLHPPPDAAVAGGNVETSQRIVDVLLGAFGLTAASQGTMNNFSFGDSNFGYYETLGGGEGASPGHSGAHAVHTHMTNTRLTDPETLEMRYPVTLTEFSQRRDSGGKGMYAGGDGMVRQYRMLKPLRVSLLTQRRKEAPWGAKGGDPGQCGKNSFWRKSRQAWEILPGSISFDIEAGDEIRIETPGGGGWGQGNPTA